MLMSYSVRSFLMDSAKNPASAYCISAKAPEDAVRAAREFCQRIFCESHTACGTCLPCRKFEAGNMVDYLEIGVQEGQDQIRIGEVRGIAEFLSGAAYEGGYRCIHVVYAQRLTVQSQNFLLKTIEEPPNNVVFVFSVDAIHKLLPTIRSRCMEMVLESLPRKEVFQQLCKKGIHEQQAAYIAAWAGGSLIQAEKILADEQLAQIRQKATAIALRLATKRNPSMYLLEQDFLSAGKRMPEILYAIASLFADAALWPCSELMLNNPDAVQTIDVLARQFTLPQIQRIIELLNQRTERKLRYPQFRDDLMIKSLIFDILEVRAW